MDLLEPLRISFCVLYFYRLQFEINNVNNKPQKISRYASEFVGTFVLVACIKLLLADTGVDSTFRRELAPFGIGLTLLVIVSIYGYISLAQFNPSVTIGFIVRDCEALPRKDWFQWCMYFVMQFTGGIAGGYFAWLCGGKAACQVYTQVKSDEYTAYHAFFAELFFCMMLVTVNLHVAGDARLKGNQVYAAAIGMILTVAALSIGEITGSAVNTAVWVGTVASAAACQDEGEKLNLDHCWIYWVAHFLAGIISGGWFVLIYGEGMDGEGKGTGDNVMEPIDHIRKPGGIGAPSQRNVLAYDQAADTDAETDKEIEMGGSGGDKENRKGSVVDELLKAEVPQDTENNEDAE